MSNLKLASFYEKWDQRTLWCGWVIRPSFIALNNSQSQTPVSQAGGHTKWHGSLDAWHSSDDNTLLNITTLCISTPSGKRCSLLPASLSNGANQTNSKSICNSNHADFLPSAIISMVYLLTQRFLKAGASRGLSPAGQLLMSLCCSS